MAVAFLVQCGLSLLFHWHFWATMRASASSARNLRSLFLLQLSLCTGIGGGGESLASFGRMMATPSGAVYFFGSIIVHPPLPFVLRVFRGANPDPRVGRRRRQWRRVSTRRRRFGFYAMPCFGSACAGLQEPPSELCGY